MGVSVKRCWGFVYTITFVTVFFIESLDYLPKLLELKLKVGMEKRKANKDAQDCLQNVILKSMLKRIV